MLMMHYIFQLLCAYISVDRKNLALLDFVGSKLPWVKAAAPY